VHKTFKPKLPAISIACPSFVKYPVIEIDCESCGLSGYQPAVYPGYQNPPGRPQPIGRAKNITPPRFKTVEQLASATGCNLYATGGEVNVVKELKPLDLLEPAARVELAAC
jgi:hypothetical protein